MTVTSSNENPRRQIFNELAPTWDSYSLVTAEKAQAIRGFIEALDLGTETRVLDIGCGTGVLAPFIAEKLGSRGSCVGLDISEAMIEEARKKNFDTRFSFIRKDIYHFDAERESFDAVIAYQVFPHLHDKEKALSIFGRLLKPGGRLCIAHVASSIEINKLHKERVSNPVLKTDYLPTAHDLAGMLLSAGFRVDTALDIPGRFLVKAVRL